MFEGILFGFVLPMVGSIVAIAWGTMLAYFWVHILESMFCKLDERKRRKEEAQFQARMQNLHPDGEPFQGRWYVGEDGKRFWLDWWNVPTIDL
jgi:hypothetical protein